IALEVMLRRPDLFGACMPLQAAIERRQAASYAKRFSDVFGSRAPSLHIVTSTRDLYQRANHALYEQLKRRSFAVDYTEPFGHHATSFMREVGSLELLLWMSRTLRGDGQPELRRGGYPPGYPLEWIAG